MKLKLPVRGAWTDINILVDKLSSLNEKFNTLTTLLSEESLKKQLKVKLQNLTIEHETCIKHCATLL